MCPRDLEPERLLYPKGTLHKFSFSKDKPLNVYTDTVVLRLPLPRKVPCDWANSTSL